MRVLVVDDNPADFELIVRALRAVLPDVVVVQAETREEMRAALDPRPDVVLVDWILPRFSAPGALEVLAELTPPPLCIVVSGVSADDRAITAVKLGAQDFLTKDRIREIPHVIERELAFRKERGG